MNKNLKLILALVAMLCMIFAATAVAEDWTYVADGKFVCEHGVTGTAFGSGAVPSVMPTCDEEGYGWVKVANCNTCGEKYEVEYPHPDYPTYKFAKVPLATTSHTINDDGACENCEFVIPAESVIADDCGGYHGFFTCDDCTELEKAYGKRMSCEFVEPTCEEDGKYYHRCHYCGNLMQANSTGAYIIVVKSNTALGHEWATLETLKAADCKNEVVGIDKVMCLNCETISYQQNLGHVVKETFVEATCESPAKVIDVCTLCEAEVGYAKETIEDSQLECGKEYPENRLFVTVYPEDYEGEEEDLMEATCTEDGYGFYICKFCGEYTTEEPVTVAHPENGHDFVAYDAYVEATCEDPSGLKAVCSECGEEGIVYFGVGDDAYVAAKGSHQWEAIETVEPTCQDAGYTLYRCSVCDTEKEDDEVAKDEDAHVKQLIGSPLKEATCTSNGIGKYECALCEEALGYLSIPADHTWYTVEETVATCVEDGVKVERCIYECLDEDGELVEQETVTKATGKHSYTKETYKDATCEAPAKAGFVCATCDKEDPEHSMVTSGTALGHDWKTVKELEGYTGYYAYLRKCSNCQKVEHVKVANGDTEVEPITCIAYTTDEENGNYAATCSTKGWAGKAICQLCGAVMAEGDEVAIDTTAHVIDKLVEPALKEATCSTTGIGKYICSLCGKSETAEYKVIAITHDLVLVEETPATCDEDGLKVYVCANGCELDEDVANVVIKATGEHNFVETTIDATCTEKAKAGEQCSVCGEPNPENPMVEVGTEEPGHTWKKGKEITVEGYAYAYLAECSVCGETSHFGVNTGTDGEEPIGHVRDEEAYDEDNYAATCSTEGWKDKEVCALCGFVMNEGEVIEIPEEPTEDQHDELVPVVVLKAATCSDYGIGKYGCPNCDYVRTSYEKIDAAHTLVEVERVDATCEEDGDGYVIYECAYGCELDEDIAKETLSHEDVEHIWEDFYALATCTEDAKVGEKCSVCNAINEETLVIVDDGDEEEGTGHDFAEYPVEESCKFEAGIAQDCKNCDYYNVILVGSGESAEKDVAEHTYVTETVEATCKEVSVTTKTCSACGDVQIEKGTEVDPDGHKPVPAENPVKPATCTVDGIGKHVCELCGDELGYQVIKADHAWTLVEEVAPTCGEDGYELYVCELGCKYETGEHAGEPVEKIVDLDATGEHVSDEEEETIDATCTEKAKVGQICEVCGEAYNTKVVEGSKPAGHKEVAAPDKAATCQDDGYEGLFVCEVCDEPIYIDGVYKVIEASDEYHVTIETPVSEATCAKAGISKHECTLCDYSEYKAKTVEHTESEPISSEDGTCVYWYCTVCGYLEVIEEFEGYKEPAYDCILTGMHTEETVEGVEPTCTEEGLSDGVKCSVCDTIIVAQETLDVVDHAWDEGVVTTPATEETEGEMTYTCGDCGETKTEAIAKLDHEHVYEAVVTEPTCAAAGYTTYTCKCGDTYVGDEVATLPHTEEVVAGKAATCTEEGLSDGVKCTVCGAELVAQEVVSANGHAWNDGVVTTPATEETEGEMTYTCGDCGETKTEAIAKVEHKHVEELVAAKAATCTETGLTEGVICSACNEVLFAQEIIPALGHTEKVLEAKAATCTEAGLTDGVVCTVCNTVIEAQEEILALGHTVKTVAGKAATCTEAGLTDGEECTVCGAVLEEQKEIAAAGHKEETVAGKAATCTEAGKTEGTKCSVCGEILKAQEEIAAKGHSYKVTKYTYNEDYTEETTHYTCSGCGDTDTETNPF